MTSLHIRSYTQRPPSGATGSEGDTTVDVDKSGKGNGDGDGGGEGPFSLVPNMQYPQSAGGGGGGGSAGTADASKFALLKTLHCSGPVESLAFTPATVPTEEAR